MLPHPRGVSSVTTETNQNQPLNSGLWLAGGILYRSIAVQAHGEQDFFTLMRNTHD
jgi:hypothetical protein